MPTSTSVKYFHSAMSGAPVLSGTAGTLIGVLDACLVNGFNLKTVDSLVVAGGVATANISAGVGAFAADTVVLVDGATPSELNGEKRIISSSTTTITFDATGVSDQTATGTVTAKLAPVGWGKPFSGTNLGVYRSADVTGTRMYLRVDDTGTTNARVVGYESMSDVNTGLQPFPNATQMSGGLYWPKANAANATARVWTLIADSRTVWLHIHTAASSLGAGGHIQVFGDFTSRKSGDTYSCHLSGANSDISSGTGVHTSSMSYSSAGASATSPGFYIPRSYSGVGSAINASHRSESYLEGAANSGQSTVVAQFPNGPDSSLLLSRMAVYEVLPDLRGYARGLLVSPQNCHGGFVWGDKLVGDGSYSGRKLMAVKAGSAASTTSVGVCFFDITGPWG